MSKPTKYSLLASKIYSILRECETEYQPQELLTLQLILKEELKNKWLFDLLSAAEKAVIVSTEKKQLYETCCNDLPDGQLDQVRKRREWLEKRIALSVTGDRNQCRLSIPTVTPLPANSFFDHVLDNLTQVMSQVCDKNPGTSDVDLCELSHDVSNSLTSVPDIIQSLMFQDLDQYLTRLVLDFDPQQCLKERQRVKSVLLQLEVRLDHVEERMSRFILSIEKRKGCWIREISRLLTEIVNNNCRLKLLATSHERQTNLLPDYREADRLVDSVVIDSSLTGDDDLDTHLRSLEQMIRSTD